jgi:hypothetical protein
MSFGSFLHSVSHIAHKVVHTVAKAPARVYRSVARPAVNAIGRHVVKPAFQVIKHLPVVSAVAKAIEATPIDDLIKKGANTIVHTADSVFTTVTSLPDAAVSAAIGPDRSAGPHDDGKRASVNPVHATAAANAQIQQQEDNESTMYTIGAIALVVGVGFVVFR